MSAPTSFMVACHGDAVYIRPVGLANMKHAPVLDAFLQSQLAEGALTICVDLSSCSGMDSTFMGLMVGISHAVKERGGRLVVVAPSPTNLRLLHMLGLSSVIPVLDQCQLPELQFVALASETDVGQRERIEVVKRAHQSLMELNEANRAKFTAFMVALEADLDRHRPPI